MNDTAVKSRKAFTIPHTAIFALVHHPGGGDPADFLAISTSDAEDRIASFVPSPLNEDVVRIGVERDATGEVSIALQHK